MFQMLCDRHSLCPNLKSASSQKQGVKGYVFFFFLITLVNVLECVIILSMFPNMDGAAGGSCIAGIIFHLYLENRIL